MRFLPEQHLRRQGDIRSAREKGRRLDAGAFTIWMRQREPGQAKPLPRAGVVASAAAVGGAVQRNRAKRRLREIFRRHQGLAPADCDLLIVARAAVIRRPFPELERRFAEALGRAGSKTEAAVR